MVVGGQIREVNTSITEGLPLFQRAGSIVSLQNPSGEKIVTDLTNVSLELSIALHNNRAHGHVYIEDGSESDFKTEYHEIWAENDVITFK